MFGFFKNIKAEVAEIKAKFEALEAKVEAFFAPKAVVNTTDSTQAPAETPVTTTDEPKA